MMPMMPMDPAQMQQLMQLQMQQQMMMMSTTPQDPQQVRVAAFSSCAALIVEAISSGRCTDGCIAEAVHEPAGGRRPTRGGRKEECLSGS